MDFIRNTKALQPSDSDGNVRRFLRLKSNGFFWILLDVDTFSKIKTLENAHLTFLYEMPSFFYVFDVMQLDFKFIYVNLKVMVRFWSDNF